MSKVITFSQTFPSYHPKHGEPTHFVEKLWESLIATGQISLSRCCELSRQTGIGGLTMNSIRQINFSPKYHTIRAGHRFKEREFFSPRVWSGKPYNSKQIILAPDVQIKKIWNIKMIIVGGYKEFYVNNLVRNGSRICILALNDGLTSDDLHWWFKKPFEGQVICWNEKLDYDL